MRARKSSSTNPVASAFNGRAIITMSVPGSRVCAQSPQDIARAKSSIPRGEDPASATASSVVPVSWTPTALNKVTCAGTCGKAASNPGSPTRSSEGGWPKARRYSRLRCVGPRRRTVVGSRRRLSRRELGFVCGLTEDNRGHAMSRRAGDGDRDPDDHLVDRPIEGQRDEGHDAGGDEGPAH